MESIHKSVLVQECLATMLVPKNHKILLVDGTLGEGGHSLNFLNACPTLKVIGIDADSEIQEVAKARLNSFQDRVEFYLGWSDEFFANYPSEKDKPDLILLDLGISMYHYVASKKGFSFNKEDSLDMRLSSSLDVSAMDIVNSYSEKEIARILNEYGEERYSNRIARGIVKMRETKKIESAKELASIIFDFVPNSYKHASIHPATKTFQALRIEVNHELKRLPHLLQLAFETLAIGGRLGVITFHSLEDRVVKKYFRELSCSCTCPSDFPVCKCGGVAKGRLVNKKAIKPSEDEVKANHAARSAKLRVIEKI
ncbi:MAG: 16S rRNA (cytosine(1402)-N(4))-methyltransferase RsmH [Treponema sp.]